MGVEAVTLRIGDLVLRPWRPSDRSPFAALNADPEVMAHFPRPLTRGESDAFVDRIEADFADHGWGLWALDAPLLGFVGFVGLARPNFVAHFTSPEDPAVEVGWRLARSAWGRGWATAAAREVLRHAFDILALDEVVSFTTAANTRSRAVMARLGMTYVAADDFDHPRLVEPEHAHRRRHVLYRIDARTHRSRAGGAAPDGGGAGRPLTS